MGISFGKLAGRRSIVASVLLAAGAGAWAQGKNNGTDKVVYHIDNAAAQATKGLRNVRNHLDVAPETKIIVVTHANGIDFLMEGAKDPKNPNIDYAALVSALKTRGRWNNSRGCTAAARGNAGRRGRCRHRAH